MTTHPAPDPHPRHDLPTGVDLLTVGRRVRHQRTARGMTLEDLADAVGSSPSQLSVLENGRREPKVSQLQAIAAALGCPLTALLVQAPPSRRDALEISLERYQRGAVFAELGLPHVRVGRGLPTAVLELLVGLQQEVLRLHAERSATPEEARRANAELRAQMRDRDNHDPVLEARAADLLRTIGHSGGPLSQGRTAALATHLGFSLHYVGDLPPTTRSVTDRENGRIYLPAARSRTAGGSGDARTALLRTLAGIVLGHGEATSYAELLRQRVESNYLSAALLIPEESAVGFLRRAKAERELSVEDLRDAFAVPYETAAHRFTNLASVHLDLPVHFMKVDRAGHILKAYENDGVRFPTDVLGAVEGQPVCRHWTARTVFDIADQLSPHYQYTDTPVGTFWCTARTQPGDAGAVDGLDHSVTVGVRYADVRWFRGRETTERTRSSCPDPSCCRTASPDLTARWEGRSWASPRMPSSLLASAPVGSFGGVDTPAVYDFLQRHAPRG